MGRALNAITRYDQARTDINLLAALRELDNPEVASAPPSTGVTLAQTLWVAKNGNDGTALPGRLDKPYLTIQAALDAAGDGTSIFVMPGLYSETVTVPPLRTNLALVGFSRDNTVLGGIIWVPLQAGAIFSCSGLGSAGANWDGSNANPAPLVYSRDMRFNGGLTINAMFAANVEATEVPNGPIHITNSGAVRVVDADVLGFNLGWRRDQANASINRQNAFISDLRTRDDVLLGGTLQATFTESCSIEGGASIIANFTTFLDGTYDEAPDVRFAGSFVGGGQVVVNFSPHQLGQTAVNTVDLSLAQVPNAVTATTPGETTTPSIVVAEGARFGIVTADVFVAMDIRGTKYASITSGANSTIDRDVMRFVDVALTASPGTTVVPINPPLPAGADYAVSAIADASHAQILSFGSRAPAQVEIVASSIVAGATACVTLNRL